MFCSVFEPRFGIKNLESLTLSACLAVLQNLSTLYEQGAVTVQKLAHTTDDYSGFLETDKIDRK